MVRLEVVLRMRQELFSPTIGSTVKDRLGQEMFGDNTYLTYRKSLLFVPLFCGIRIQNAHFLHRQLQYNNSHRGMNTRRTYAASMAARSPYFSVSFLQLCDGAYRHSHAKNSLHILE